MKPKPILSHPAVDAANLFADRRTWLAPDLPRDLAAEAAARVQLGNESERPTTEDRFKDSLHLLSDAEFQAFAATMEQRFSDLLKFGPEEPEEYSPEELEEERVFRESVGLPPAEECQPGPDFSETYKLFQEVKARRLTPEEAAAEESRANRARAEELARIAAWTPELGKAKFEEQVKLREAGFAEARAEWKRIQDEEEAFTAEYNRQRARELKAEGKSDAFIFEITGYEMRPGPAREQPAREQPAYTRCPKGTWHHDEGRSYIAHLLKGNPNATDEEGRAMVLETLDYMEDQSREKRAEYTEEFTRAFRNFRKRDQQSAEVKAAHTVRLTEAMQLARGIASRVSAEQITAMLTAGFTDLDETEIDNIVAAVQEQLKVKHSSRWNDGLNFAIGLRKAGLDPIELDRVLGARYSDLTARERNDIHSMALGEKPLPETFVPRAEAKSWSIDDLVPLAQRSIPARSWLVEDLLPKQGLTLLSALPSHGKSILAYALGRAVSQGEDFAGLETQKCPVLYIDRENDGGYWKSEIMEEVFQQDEGDNFHFNLGTDEQAPPELNNLGLLAWVESCEIKPLIIVDSLSKYMVGMNENLAQDVDPWMVQAIALRNMGASVVIIHHMGKQGTSRGSTAIVANVDWALDITRTETTIPGTDRKGLDTIQVRVSKGRGSHKDHLFKMNYTTHELEQATKTRATAPTNLRMEELLSKNPGISGEMLVRMAMDCKPKAATQAEGRNWIAANLESGMIRQEGSRPAVKLFWTGPPPAPDHPEQSNLYTMPGTAGTAEEVPF